ncbi:hypothetical protein [Pseudomonas sp. Gutcm_11s]|uniref:hypothetical protein n=1 Tax=Pseudomonas sp. Gutcm_11s TaxID=3026088 RepID=UPI0023611ACF|nr:hypothetical protein [Pseudomonas sp. Gutcm_11s]MDD0842878.1 hypothetical protein [Pseudomonas sp. Gutcm_11s]
MSQHLQIDRSNGHLRVGGTLITPATTPAELDATFRIGETSQVQVMDRQVPCRFAYLQLQDRHLGVALSLRFESEILVSLFIELSDPQIPTDFDDDFYSSIPKREQLHRQWLTAQLGEQNDFPWGTAGVARDKSENVFIYLHNRNNGWVFGG